MSQEFTHIADKDDMCFNYEEVAKDLISKQTPKYDQFFYFYNLWTLHNEGPKGIPQYLLKKYENFVCIGMTGSNGD